MTMSNILEGQLSTLINQVSKKSALLTVLAVSMGMVGCQNTTPLNKVVMTPHTMSPTIVNQTNTSYANSRYLTIEDQNYPVSETSARVLIDPASKALKLLPDIFDGKGQSPVPGYKIMLINRTSSLAAEGRVRDGKIIDNRMIHRGSKSLVGIPVINGKARIDQAQLLDFDVIYDDPNKALVEGEVVKPRGEKMTKPDVPVTNKQIMIRSLTLPNVVSGESAGGGVVFEASALVNGKLVKTGANSAFNIFDTTTPDKAKGF